MYRQLPWSMANENLVELFGTTGHVELAENLFDGTRSKGAGVINLTVWADVMYATPWTDGPSRERYQRRDFYEYCTRGSYKSRTQNLLRKYCIVERQQHCVVMNKILSLTGYAGMAAGGHLPMFPYLDVIAKGMIDN